MTVTQPITGLAWHVHHDILVEWCYDYQERVEAIRRDKPLAEQALRLRLFQIVKGPLPPEYAAALATYVAASVEYAATYAAASVEYAATYAAAWAEYAATYAKYAAAYAATWATYTAAKAKYAAAWAEYAAAYAKAKPQLLTLHAIECLDCSWNGKTIFPERGTA